MTTETGNDIVAASRFLALGQPVGIPTETVYGLAANALDENAVLRIFEVKNRPHFDPLIVHTYAKSEIGKYVQHIPALAEKLIDAFMPGPVTVLLRKNSLIPDLVTSGLDNVAIRIPNHPVALALLQQLPFPLAAPSANPFGYISPTTAQHVYDQLQGKIPYILDGGATNIGVESTIVGFEDDGPVVYRLGGLAIEDIERVIGKVRVQLNESSNPQSPGMLKSHYAPRKRLTMYDVLQPVSNTTGVIAFDSYISGIDEKHQILLSPTGDLNEAAKNLFAAMRRLDASDVTEIVAVKFPDTGLGRAINDRLKRASA
ncbi:MAG TPA: L-threonylcarbamoyladenylate synthase [Chitinophagales bacterium]|nr:L-threonylcarbamoyladenylate synthase [Chitinophagales bacterium]